MNMRKIMMALPCLLFCGFVAAKEAPALDARHNGADVLLATAIDTGSAEVQPVIGSGVMVAAAKKKPAKLSPKPAAAPIAQPTDTSKRFNMTQNGKRMTADDFDAWMKKNGYRVATGAPSQAKEEAPKKGTK
jgi:hypothetical protein